MKNTKLLSLTIVPWAMLTALLLIAGVNLHAQNCSTPTNLVSDKGAFRANFIRGCSPLTLKFTTGDCFKNNTTSNSVKYSWRYADAPIDQESSYVAFSQENNYSPTETFNFREGDEFVTKIIVVLRTDFDNNTCGGVQRDELLIEVYNVPPPTVTATYCEDKRVSIFIESNVPECYRYTAYTINFGDGSANQTRVGNGSKEYTYASTDNKQITVIGKYSNGPGNAENNCGTTTINVNPIEAPTIPTDFKIKFYPRTNKQLELSGTFQDRVTFDVDDITNPDGSSQSVDNIFGDGNFITKQLSVVNGKYRLVVKSCANRAVNIATSRPFYTVNFAATPNVDGIGILLEYDAPYGLEPADKVVFKKADNILTSTTESTIAYIDEDVVCGETYTYTVEVQDENGRVISYANPIEVINQNSNSLPPINNIVSYWQDSKVFISPRPQLKNQTLLLKNAEGKVLTSSVADQLSVNYNANQPCFIVDRQDQCGNTAVSATEFCPSLLQVTSLKEDEDFIELSWNAYSGYQNGVKEYIVYTKSPAGDWQLLERVGTVTTYKILNKYTIDDIGTQFKVEIVPEDIELENSYTSIYTYELSIIGYFPTAFSPNGDGVNDEFGILGSFVTYCDLTIYDRWGQPIFRKAGEVTNGNTNPDAQNNIAWRPQRTSPSVYTYKAFYKTKDGKNHTKIGKVLLTK